MYFENIQTSCYEVFTEMFAMAETGDTGTFIDTVAFFTSCGAFFAYDQETILYFFSNRSKE